MQRALPMFEPPTAGGHAHAAAEPITIALGGGRVDEALDGSSRYVLRFEPGTSGWSTATATPIPRPT